MKRKLLALSTMMLCASLSFAQNTLNIHQRGGGVVSYGFDEKPVVTYVGSNLHVESTTASIDYPVDNVEKLTFESRESSIEEVRVEDEEVSYTLIYTLNGQLIKRIDSKDGQATFNMQDLPAGNYIIKTNKTSFKINKK